MTNQLTIPVWASCALITIDTQRDTLDGAALEVPGTSEAVPAMRRLLGVFRRCGRPVIHVVRIYKPDGSNVDLCRRKAVRSGARVLIAGSEGCELAPGLAPDPATRLDPDLLLGGGVQGLGPGEFAVYKPRWGAFYKTPLEGHLRALGVSTLVFSGCNFPNCPRASIYEASERDFRVVLAHDATSGLYERGREELTNIGVAVMSAHEVAAAVERSCLPGRCATGAASGQGGGTSPPGRAGSQPRDEPAGPSSGPGPPRQFGSAMRGGSDGS